MGRKINLLLKVFGELTAVEELPSVKTSGGNLCTKWKCKCSCGEYTDVFTSALRSGMTRSCGHLQKEIVSNTGKRNRKQNPVLTAEKSLFSRARNAARQGNKEWKLTIEEFRVFIYSKCYWCGIEPINKYNPYLSQNGYSQRKDLDWARQCEISVNGIDRINNSEGYKTGNCFPCCKWCNFSRNCRTPEEFKDWIKRISEYAAINHK